MHIFTQPISQSYNGLDASIEILVMLFGAGLIGYHLHARITALRAYRRRGLQIAHIAAPEAPAILKAPETPSASTKPLVSQVPASPRVPDDLERIEGIGPKVKLVLNAAQIHTFAQVSSMTPKALKIILERAGDRFRVIQTDSWPVQAALARDGKLKELAEYQAFLVAGREPAGE